MLRGVLLVVPIILVISIQDGCIALCTHVLETLRIVYPTTFLQQRGHISPVSLIKAVRYQDLGVRPLSCAYLARQPSHQQVFFLFQTLHLVPRAVKQLKQWMMNDHLSITNANTELRSISPIHALHLAQLVVRTSLISAYPGYTSGVYR